MLQPVILPSDEGLILVGKTCSIEALLRSGVRHVSEGEPQCHALVASPLNLRFCGCRGLSTLTSNCVAMPLEIMCLNRNTYVLDISRR